jgi:uncharacterized protein (TIGR03382 family)
MKAKIHTFFIALTLCSLGPRAIAAEFTNGNFADFSGWGGELVYADDPFTPTAVSPNLDPLFTLENPDAARITTSPDQDLANNVFEVTLLQDFDLSASALGLSFRYWWTLSDSGFDLPAAYLIWGAGGGNVLDLFLEAGVDTAVASVADELAEIDFRSLPAALDPRGNSVRLELRITDGGDDVSDWLQVGSVAIAEAPIPGSLALLATGLVLLGRRRRGHEQRSADWSAKLEAKQRRRLL